MAFLKFDPYRVESRPVGCQPAKVAKPAKPTNESDGDFDEAKRLILLCQEHNIGLKLEDDGTVVVQSQGRAWRGLIADIERNIDAVAGLIDAGWNK